MQCCLEPLPVQSCQKNIKAKLHRDFFMQCCLEPLGQYFIRCLPVQCCPKSIKTTLHIIFFLYKFVWSLSDNIAQSFYLCNIVPTVLRQNCRGIFLIQSFLEPLEQHCIGFSVAQCCPKSIKTTLHRNFSYATLSGAFWTTLHKIFTCAMLLKEY